MTADATPQPVRRALVSVSSADAARGAAARAVVTDDEGRFAISPLPPGRYTLSASKPSYVTTAYGAPRPGRPGTPIQLGAGQRMAGVSIRLTRGAVVVGTVLDQNSEPVPSARVTLMKYSFSAQNGERVLQPAGPSGVTDDRGMYRIYGIAPGDYVVELNPPFSLPGDLRQTTEQGLQAALRQFRSEGIGAAAPSATPVVQSPAGTFAPIFYPGTTVAASATTLKLAPGEERSGIDLQYQLVPTAKIEGTVIGADGLPAANAQVSVLGSGPGDASLTMMMTSMFGGGRANAEGRFTLSGIAPGHYTLAARGGGGRGAAGAAAPAPLLWATTEVDVHGQDVSGVQMMLEPGMRVSGHIVFQGTAPPPADLTALRVTLMPILSGSSVAAVVQPAQADAQGRFGIEGVMPGRYRVSSTTASPWTLASAATPNVRNALDGGLEVKPNETVADLVLTFTDRATALEGTLQDATGRPASDYSIIVYAKDRAFWTPPSRRIAMMRPANDGKFSTRILPAGEYLLAAVTDVEPGEWMDPSFLEQLVGASISVSLADGETTTRDIRIAGR